MGINKYINAVKNAPIVMAEAVEQDTIIGIELYGRTYYGVAYLHDEDADYYSPIVGGTIAHMRAMENAISQTIWEVDDEIKTIKHLYSSLQQSLGEDADPQNKILFYMRRLENNLTQLRSSRRELRKEIATYIKDQSKAIEILKKNRSKLDK